MAWIGQVIQYHRDKQSLSRKDLTQGICSEKYLYMIEKGERTPSSEVTNLFNARLAVNLFKYYEFLDCQDPVLVSHAIEKFNVYRRTSDFMHLREYTNRIEKEPDFQKIPHSYEIKVNKLIGKMFLDGKYQEVIEDANKLIAEIDEKYQEEEFMANLLIIQSTALQYCHRITEAREILDKVIKIVCNKEGVPRYHQVMATSRLNRMTLAYLEEDYQSMIEHGEWLLEFSKRTNSYKQTSYTYYYLSLGHWGLGQKEQMVFWLESCLNDLLIQHSPYVVYFITTFGSFSEMIKYITIRDETRERLKESYPEFSDIL